MDCYDRDGLSISVDRWCELTVDREYKRLVTLVRATTMDVVADDDRTNRET